MRPAGQESRPQNTRRQEAHSFRLGKSVTLVFSCTRQMHGERLYDLRSDAANLGVFQFWQEILSITTNHSTSQLSGHLEIHRHFLLSPFSNVYFIVIFITNYKYIKVTHQNNREGCREL